MNFNLVRHREMEVFTQKIQLLVRINLVLEGLLKFLTEKIFQTNKKELEQVVDKLENQNSPKKGSRQNKQQEIS